MKSKIFKSSTLLIFFTVVTVGTVYASRQSHDVTPVVVMVNPDRQELMMIQQTASTNANGINLTIYTDGSESVQYPEKGVLSSALHTTQYPAGTIDISELETTVSQVGDVSKLSVDSCAKSASFGTETYITYQGKTSPDLQCLSDASQEQYPFLVDDINEALQPYEDQLNSNTL